MKNTTIIIGILIILIIVAVIFYITEEIPKEPPTEQSIMLRPNAPGTYTSLVQVPNTGEHWDKVDDIVHDGDATYVHGANDIDTFNIDGSIPNDATVHNIAVYFYISADGVGGPWMSDSWVILITEGSMYDVSTGGFQGDGTWELKSYKFDTNPVTGLAWTPDEINSLEIGFKAVSSSFWSKFTQIYAEVNYLG